MKIHEGHDDQGAFPSIIQLWIQVEKEIQKRTDEISCGMCVHCQPNCCAEKICQESLSSSFLRLLVQLQDVSYDLDSGWLGPRGCRLKSGRPLVCYDYFCDPMIDSDIMQSSGIRELIKQFKSVGNRAHGHDHLICMSDLNQISAKKLVTMRQKLEVLLKEFQDSNGTV